MTVTTSARARTRVRSWVAFALVTAIVCGFSLVSSSPAQALQSSQVFNPIGSGGLASRQTWTRQTAAPATNWVKITAIGASSCDSSSCSGAGQVVTIIPVTGNLTIDVGHRASGINGGWGGGSGGDSETAGNDGVGGGGSSDVSNATGSFRILAAGGGGGNGGTDPGDTVLKGGTGGDPGGNNGQASSAGSGIGQGGRGATQSAVGAGGNQATGIGCNQNGSPGSGSSGGDGATAASTCNSGGGGGGGWFGGGGGGNASNTAGGGGGGSSNVNSLASPVAGSTVYSVASPTTDPSVTVTPVDHPTVTTSAATSVTGTSATLNGTVNANGVTTIGQHFVYGTDPTLSTGTSTAAASQAQSSGTSTNAISAAISGLANGTTYYFRARADNGLDGQQFGTIQSFTTAGAPTATTKVATNVTTTSATLNATVNANGDSTTVSFIYGPTIELDTDTTEVAAVPGTVTGTTPTDVIKNVSGLPSGPPTYYKVKTVNTYGTTYGAVQNATGASVCSCSDTG